MNQNDQNNFNIQGNNDISNNQSINNLSFNNNQTINSNSFVNQNYQQPASQPVNQMNVQQPINSQPQPTPSYEQPIIQQPLNQNNKKKNVGLIIGIIIVALLIIGVLVIVLNQNKNKTNDDVNYENRFAEDVVLNDATINGVKISEINTMNDAFNKLNSEITWVTVCYTATEEDQGCPNYSYYEFTTDKVSKEGISSLIFTFNIKNTNLSFDFATSYKTYKRDGYNSLYYELKFHTDNMVKLNNQYVENVSIDTIKSNYTLSSTSDYWYYIDFNSNDGDKYRYTGYPNSNMVEVFNYTERDRGIK